MVALLDCWVFIPCGAAPDPGRAVLLAVLVPVHFFFAVVVVSDAFEAIPFVLALVVFLEVPVGLPQDSVVCQGEWRWGLFAWPVVSESIGCDVPVFVLAHLHQSNVDVHVAGVVVRLDLESHGLCVRGRVEGELRELGIAPDGVPADRDLCFQGVLFTGLETIDGYLHRVVPGSDEGHFLPSLALPVASVVLLAVGVVVPEVWLAVAVLVPVGVPAIVVSVIIVLALVVCVVVHDRFPNHAIRG